jgi:hypothetical protein
MSNYVYKETEHNSWGSLYTVGYYDPQGNWHPESDHDSKADAAARVHYLNGGCNQNCNCNRMEK